jgi:general secretion pathway protein H
MASGGSRPAPGAFGQFGFTLLEMIVVLVIIGLVLSLIAPNFGRGSGRYAVAATAHDVAAALRLARDQAIARDRPTRFVAGADGFGANGDGHLRHVPRGITLVVSDAAQTDAGSDAGAIRFFPDGSSTGGGIDVTDGTARYAVIVNWLNGNVSIRPRPAAPRK